MSIVKQAGVIVERAQLEGRASRAQVLLASPELRPPAQPGSLPHTS